MGLCAGRARALATAAALSLGLRFLTAQIMASLLLFPPDMAPVDAEINRLNNQILVRYYEHEWRQVMP